MRRFGFVLLLGILTMFLKTAYAQAVWTRSLPFPTGQSLVKVINIGARLVAVGNDGGIVTSSDGISWINRVSGTNATLAALTWTGTLLVAAGVDGTILTSPQVPPVNTGVAALPQLGFSFHLTRSSLFVSLPKSMQDHATQAVIYGIAGEKVFDQPIAASQSEIVLSVSSLQEGRYLLEVGCPGKRVAKPFILTRH